MQVRQWGRRIIAVTVASSLLGCSTTKQDDASNTLDEIIVGRVSCDVPSIENTSEPTITLTQNEYNWDLKVYGTINLELTHDNSQEGLLVSQAKNPTAYSIGHEDDFDREIYIAKANSADSVRVDIKVDKTSRKARINVGEPSGEYASVEMNPGFIGKVVASGGKNSISSLKINGKTTLMNQTSPEASAAIHTILPHSGNATAHSRSSKKGDALVNCTAEARAIDAVDDSNLGRFPER